MKVVDTSVLYALYDAGDVHHDAARSVFSAERILACRGILQESLDLMAYRHGKHHAEAMAAHLMSLPHVRIVPDGPFEDVLRAWREHARLSLADAGAVAVAWAMGAGLASFDRSQRRAFEAGPGPHSGR